MEKYKSQYPTLRQAKTNWSKQKDPYAAPHLGWVKKATDFQHGGPKVKLLASIIAARMGIVHQKIREESGQDLIYHVTHTKHVAKIQKQGIMPMKTSNWVKAGNKDRYGGGEVYAFTHKADAHAWAGKMDWAHNKTLGSGKISIITAKRPTDRKFERDENDPLSQAGRKGDWLKTHGSIEPHHIVSVEPYHPKKLGEDRIGKPTPSAEEIAKKHNKEVAEIQAQIDKGIKVEREHTNSDAEAHEIARDHLDEFPDYYDRLDAMEKKAKKDIKEGYDPDVEQTRNRIEAHKKVADKMAQTHGEHSQEAAFHRAYVKHMQKQLKDQYGLDEMMAVGSGAVAGMPTADPPELTPVRGPVLRRKKFAGKTVFVVKPDTFYKSYLGKRKYEHYEKFLEGCEGFEEIRDFGRKYWDEPIILEDETTGAMVYLKYGRK